MSTGGQSNWLVDLLFSTVLRRVERHVRVCARVARRRHAFEIRHRHRRRRRSARLNGASLSLDCERVLVRFVCSRSYDDDDEPLFMEAARSQMCNANARRGTTRRVNDRRPDERRRRLRVVRAATATAAALQLRARAPSPSPRPRSLILRASQMPQRRRLVVFFFFAVWLANL